MVAMSLLVLCNLLLLSTIWAAQGEKQKEIDFPIRVFDNVLRIEERSRLHNFCSSSWNNPDVLFEFPLPRPPAQHNIIEQVLRDVIEELYGNETSYYVEYWTRQKWFHTLAHADMDEGLRRVQEEEKGLYDEPFRHPIYGHVLYLKVGANVRGPTCVFNVSKGGDIGIMSARDNVATDFFVVPAKEGRVLQFQGDLLHAVPRPADLWLHPRMETLLHEPKEVWGRSVLLFNLWPREEPMLVGRQLSETVVLDADELPSQASLSGKLCNDFSDWKERPVRDRTSSRMESRIEFPLMGDEKRRGTEERSVVLRTSGSSEDAFIDDDEPSHLWVQVPKKEKSWLFSFMGVEL